jgi:hypothetical protein
MSTYTIFSRLHKSKTQMPTEGRDTKLPRLGSVLLLIAFAFVSYMFVIRPAGLRWGATDAEVGRVIAGDELIAHPSFNATRAVTIDAPPEAIWPWLMQWGYGKAGFYGYDLLENIGSPNGIRSADRLLPQYQHLAVGDKVKMTEPYFFCVRTIEPNHFLLLAGCSGPSLATMAWVLEPLDENHTRLIHRIRMEYPLSQPAVLPAMLFSDLADHVAVPKLLLGFKGRVEGKIEPLRVQVVEITNILLVIIACLVGVFQIFRRQKWASWVLLTVISISLLEFVLYSHAYLWIKTLFVIALWIAVISVARAQRKPQLYG